MIAVLMLAVTATLVAALIVAAGPVQAQATTEDPLPDAPVLNIGHRGASGYAPEGKVGDFRYAHFDNDYYEREGPADGHHVSDHDPPVLTLSK
jgi:hypothetical protein